MWMKMVWTKLNRKQQNNIKLLYLAEIIIMSENEELQNEELEVLKSIYEGDECYTNPEAKSHLYKFGEVGTLKTFILGNY